MEAVRRIEPYRQPTRGRSREQFIDRGVPMSASDEFPQHANHPTPRQDSVAQRRRARSADSRPQYHNSGTSDKGFHDPPSLYNATSYRERHGFPLSTSHGDPDRPHSDVGVDVGTEFPFYELPRYDGVIHDDSVLYSNSDRRQNRGNASIQQQQQQQSSIAFPAWGNRSPPRSSAAAKGRPAYSNNNRIDFAGRRHPGATRPMNERDRQYYDFAKENLITFGSMDEPTESTGHSREELLQRRRTEETREKRKEKKRNNKSRNRIINFPTGLLKSSSSQQQNYVSPQNQPQNQPSSSNYRNLAKLTSLEGDGRGENVFDDSGDRPNPDNNGGGLGGIRGSMVRRQQSKSKNSQNYTTTEVREDNGWKSSQTNYMEDNRGMNPRNGMENYDSTIQQFLGFHDDSNKPNNSGLTPTLLKQHDKFDPFMENPDLLPGNAKNTPSYDHQDDYLLVQRDFDRSTPKPRGSNIRPAYADFTPKSEYTPRDLFFSKRQPITKDVSPTSVMDMHNVGNSSSVRWNKKLTQQEFIVTPQSTKLRPDSDRAQLRNSFGKPKSILRSRYTSSYTPKGQTEDRAPKFSNDFPEDEYSERQPDRTFMTTKSGAHAFDNNAVGHAEARSNHADFPTMMGLFDSDSGMPLSPSASLFGTDRPGEANGKFPESYVQFIEAVAAVVIQTKVRQKLAKNKVRWMRNRIAVNQMRNRLAMNQKDYRGSESRMTPMVRKSYGLVRKVREGNELKKSRGRKDVALDFYALAAIQIQAAYRGWWVRDSLALENYCATMIQKTYRGSYWRNELRAYLNKVVTVQSICRRWMALDTAVTRIYCIVRIQAIMRGSLVRKRIGYDSLEVYHEAATAIQTIWRSFWCEMTFLRAYEDILVVQSIVRGWITRRRFRTLKARGAKFSKRFETNKRSKFSNVPKYSMPTYSSNTQYTKKIPSFMSKSESSTSRSFALQKANKSSSGNRQIHSQSKAYNEKRETPSLESESETSFRSFAFKKVNKTNSGSRGISLNASSEERETPSPIIESGPPSYRSFGVVLKKAKKSDSGNRENKSRALNEKTETASPLSESETPSSRSFGVVLKKAKNANSGNRQIHSQSKTFIPKRESPSPTSELETPFFGSQLVQEAKNPDSGNKEIKSQWSAYIEKKTNRHKSTSNKMDTNSKPESNISKNTVNNLPSDKSGTSQKGGWNAGKSLSESRADLERRRKDKEEQAKAQKEEESRRQESQAAEMAEIELRRKKMAMKAAQRKKEELANEQMAMKAAEQKKEELANEQTNNSTIPMNTSHKSYKSYEGKKMTDDEYFAQMRKTLVTSDPVATESSKKENHLFVKADVNKGEVVKNKIHQNLPPATEEKKSLVTKHMQELTSSVYQKEMQNLRTKSEQRRIDDMHYVFQHAGLLRLFGSDAVATQSSRKENNSFVKADVNEGGEVRTKIHQQSTPEISVVASKKEKPPVSRSTQKSMISDRNFPSPSTNTVPATKADDALGKGTDIQHKSTWKVDQGKEVLSTNNNSQKGTVGTHESQKAEKRDSHPDPRATRSGRERQLLTSQSRSTYQKIMLNLRSETEQRRIDEIHNIFQQAGLLSRVK